ncbi:MAG: anthranilate phosphoribosyltransferase, partial [Geminicoccales bacterium]
AIDTCGTGGDGVGTWNISTAASLVVAACGVPVAKHGNRGLSSKSGAADVLAALGVNIDCHPALLKKALWEAGICFLMAPRHHSAMRHVCPTRVELGTRTIFNLLGPLSNPARVKRQLIGVFAPEWVEPLARVLKGLGHEKAWVVHGAGGIDELSTVGETLVAELDQGKVRTFTITPEEVGLKRVKLDALLGGDAEHNAQAIRDLLAGKTSAFRDIALLSAAAALMVAGKAESLDKALVVAAAAIDGGKAAKTLERLVVISNEPPPEEPDA